MQNNRDLASWLIQRRSEIEVRMRDVLGAAAPSAGAPETPEGIETPPEAPEVLSDEESVEPELAPLVKEGDEEFERLLAEEEAIEASTREHHETPHFRSGDAD